MEIRDITSWVNLIKSSMSILRDLVSAGKDTASMLPNGQHKTELEHKLKEAEEKVRLTCSVENFRSPAYIQG